MLITLQRPVADYRLFLNKDTGRLPRPTWPDPDLNLEFVRSFGRITFRPLGGLNGWVGEASICDARRALRFRTLSIFQLKNGKRLPLPLRFRRFYFDGRAVAKLEVGFAAQRQSTVGSINPSTMNDILDHCLYQKVFRDFNDEDKDIYLGQSGKYIAEAYLHASTKRKYLMNDKISGKWTLSCSPIIFIQVPSHEFVMPSDKSRAVSLQKEYGFNIFFWLKQWNGQTFRVWLLQETSGWPDNNTARNLRVYLLRLHAEHQVLRSVLQKVENGTIVVEKDSGPSKFLQEYINCATRHINKLSLKSEKICGRDIEDLARLTEDKVSPGSQSALLEKLEIMNVRFNILRKVERYSLDWQGAPLSLGNIILGPNAKEINVEIFQGITNSTIISHASVQGSFNKVKEEMGEDTAKVLVNIADMVNKSNNAAAGALFNSFSDELQKDTREKSKLKQYWDGLVQILPDVAKIGGSLAKLTALFL